MAKSLNPCTQKVHDSSEDEIWEYKTIKRKKVSSRLSLKHSKIRTGTQIIAQSGTPSASQSRNRNKSGDNNSAKRHLTRARLIAANDKNNLYDISCSDIDNATGLSSPITSQVGRSQHSVPKTAAVVPSSCISSNEPLAPKFPGDEEHCPCCQMPFLAATPESQRCHVSECLDLPFVNSQECPQGVSCNNTIPSHYRKYQHQEMAKWRAKGHPKAGDVSPKEQQTAVSESASKPSSSKDGRSANCRGTTTTVTSPYFSNYKTTHASNISGQVDKDDQIEECSKPVINSCHMNGSNIAEEEESDEGLSIGRAKRSLLCDFATEQTFHIYNKVDAGTLSSMEMDSVAMEMDSVVSRSDGAGSDSDIFEDKCDEDVRKSSRDQTLKTGGGAAILPEEDCPNVSELLADAIGGDKGDEEQSVRRGPSASRKADNADDTDSSQSIICTGTSSAKENSFSFTPLSAPLTPISPNQTPSKQEFLRMLTQSTPKSTGKKQTPRKKTPKKSTPKDKVSQRGSHGKSSDSQKVPKSSHKTKPLSLSNSADITGSKKQASMLSFLKTKPVAITDENPKINRNDDFPTKTEAVVGLNLAAESHDAAAGVGGISKNFVGTDDRDALCVAAADVSMESGSSSSTWCTGTRTANLDLSKFSHKTRSNVKDVCGSVTDVLNISTVSKATGAAATSSSYPWPLQKQATSNPPMRADTLNMKTTATGKPTGSGNRPSYINPSYSKKSCPFYKRIPDTPFTVDAFRYGSVPGCKAYFLSHFHYDHYQGLTKQFTHPIYCSKITANLVLKKIRVNKSILRPLTLNESHLVEGIEVILLEANHCPGSVLFLYKLPNGQSILHTGDFRANHQMELYPQLTGVHIRQLYLDTTYCDPAYAFPSQADVIQFALDTATEFAYHKPNGLVVVGSYTIGKERIFQAIANELDCKICVDREKKNILECLEDGDLERRLTMKGEEAKVHVLPMKKLNFKELSAHLDKFKTCFNEVLAFEPTGWTHNKRSDGLDAIKPKIRRENVTLYGIPYSEHSSYTEMRRFVQFLRPDKILATVNNGNAQKRQKMELLFTEWLQNSTVSPRKPLKQTGLKDWINSPRKM